MRSIYFKTAWILMFLAYCNTFFGQKLHRTDSSHHDCLEFDFCEFTCESELYKELSTFSLTKGDFFTVKINNINPYRYNIKISTKNDTFKVGKEPPLFTAFMDISKLAEIGSNLVTASSLVATGLVESQDPLLNSTLKKIDEHYANLNECYINSYRKVYQTQTDCFENLNPKCYPEIKCNCLDLKDIESIIKDKITAKNLLEKITLDKDFTQKDKDSIMKELKSEKYSVTYLNSIYTKTYSNFLIADNANLLSTYYSFPIQVQGDMLELKIDITPKGSGKEEEKKEEAGNHNTNTLSNQSPVTININTKDTTTKAKKAEEPAKQEEGLVSADELKVSMPPAVREYHLNYKFRTNRFFYGFSSGFFVDNLKDDNYSSKPADPSNPATTYTLTKENQQDLGNFGIMASVNTGLYLSRKGNTFMQLFAGPGLTIETKLQPRLLLGCGFGKGDQNKFSINGGIAIGQVKKLSGIYDPAASYTVPQTNLYYTANQVSWFISVNYVFDLSK